jgi:hypothetical protein
MRCRSEEKDWTSRAVYLKRTFVRSARNTRLKKNLGHFTNRVDCKVPQPECHNVVGCSLSRLSRGLVLRGLDYERLMSGVAGARPLKS